MAHVRVRSSKHRRRAQTAFSFRFPPPEHVRTQSSLSLPDPRTSFKAPERPEPKQASKPPVRGKNLRSKSVPCLAQAGQVNTHGASKEVLDYNTITLQDTQDDLHLRKVVFNNLTLKNTRRGEENRNEDRFYDSIVRSQSSLQTEEERLHQSLCRHKEALRIESARLNDPRRPGFKRVNCPRLLHFDAPAQMSKQFCDVLGTKACKDCARVGQQLSSVNNYEAVFPAINVSTFRLCAQSADTQTRLSADSQSCDAWERYRRQSSWGAYKRFISATGTRPVPSRCSSALSQAASECAASESNDVIIPGTLEETGDDDERDSDLESEVDIPMSASPSPPPQHRKNSEYFSKKYRQNLSQIATPDGLRTMTPVHAEIEADKRRIMEYVWRLLAPKPPQMDVRDMNVSVYTPKAIPGIKIIEDGVESTIIVQRPPEIRDTMW